MAEFPFLPLYTDAYLADTGEANLSTLEHGAYLLLLMTMWRAGGYLTNDEAKLARYTKMSTGQWRKVWPVLEQFFRVEGDQISQGRLLDEIEKARGRSKAASDNARARHRKNNDNPSADASNPHASGTATRTTTTTTDRANALSQTASDAMSIWNDFAVQHGLQIAQKLTAPRKAKLLARVADVGGIEGWRLVVGMVGESDFLLGRTKTDFKAGLDFVLQESSFVKLIEGSYRTNKRAPSAAMDALRKLREEQ